MVEKCEAVFCIQRSNDQFGMKWLYPCLIRYLVYALYDFLKRNGFAHRTLAFACIIFRGRILWCKCLRNVVWVTKWRQFRRKERFEIPWVPLTDWLYWLFTVMFLAVKRVTMTVATKPSYTYSWLWYRYVRGCVVAVKTWWHSEER